MVNKYLANNIIRSLDDLRSNGIERALSYFRTSNKTLNRHIQSYANGTNSRCIVLEDGPRYHEGDILICKMNMKLKEVHTDGICGLYPNYTYKIKHIEKEHLVLVDVLGEEEFHVSHIRIMNDFTL